MIEDAVAALSRVPEKLDIAKLKLPNEGGVYAWWVDRGAMAEVHGSKHPTEVALDLLYIGIAPKGDRSSATLRSRVVGNHMRGNIAASTFRLTLAALLRDELALAPISRAGKLLLPTDQNLRLSQWQQLHLRLTWHQTATPWLLESALIAHLAPPLNLAANKGHSFHASLSKARAALRQLAVPEGGC